MAGPLHGTASWPGAVAIESCVYTISHGISPATATLKIAPQYLNGSPVFPDQLGDLTISDGLNTVVIPDCRLNEVKEDRDDRGLFWLLSIVDRRWKFRDLGIINGYYNQLDPHGNLIPWTIQSPTALARRCLEAMSEDEGILQLPSGLENPGILLDFFLKPSGVNPAVNWDGVPPAQALQQVADMFGCRIVYDLNEDKIHLYRVGFGADLPTGGVSIHKNGPSIRSPEIPDGIGIRGAPIRYQMRLALIPVGEEWDGSYRPINDLSYAPLLTGAVQIAIATIVCTGSSAVTFKLTVNGIEFDYPVNGGDTATVVAAALAAAINASANPKIRGVVTATSALGVVTVRGVVAGVPFTIVGGKSDLGTTPTDTIKTEVTQLPQRAGNAWDYAPPPHFGASPTGTTGVHATDRLTYFEAQRLAQKSVWKYFQVAPTDVTGSGPIQVPGYSESPIDNCKQLILQDTQVAQIVPQPNDPNLKDGLGRPFTVNFYNGWSKDIPAALYSKVGVFQFQNGNIWYQNALASANTPAHAQVFASFTIDPIWQLVKCSDFVYNIEASSGRFLDPQLVLQTAVLVRNKDDNQIECFELRATLANQPTGTMPKIAKHPDVQANVTSTYNNAGQITSTLLLEADPLVRAQYYLNGLAIQYQIVGAQVIEYNGIVPVICDGAISQVTWSVGPDGAVTTASRNTEHDTWLPEYTARRRLEFLPPSRQTELDDVSGRGRVPGVPGVGGGT